MYRCIAFLSFLLFFQYSFSIAQTQPAEVVRVDAKPQKAENTDIDTASSAVSDSAALKVQAEQHSNEGKIAKEAKPEKDEDGVDKDDLGYKIGYQIGQWLIPGLLMIIVTIMIFRRSSKGDRPEL